MNWINGFEQMCYLITALLLVDIFLRKRWTELRLFCSAALAGFALELMAVRVTGIYHYSPQFWISLGTPPYQFPFFGGLMWGGLTVCGLRITDKLGLSRLMTALVTGWLIVSMDLLLDVAAIRLDSGFWVWEGRKITLDVNHHMFMSVIWVNFLGYLFETPAVVFFHLWTEERGTKRSLGRIIIDEDISTTNIYLRTDNRLKNEVISKLSPRITGETELPDWSKDRGLMEFLNSLK